MKRKSKRALFLLMSAIMVLNGLTIGISASAENGNKDLSQYLDEFYDGKYPVGGTVVKDENSPTGYIAHIVYSNTSATSALVYLGFAYFDFTEKDCILTPGYNPWEYRYGMWAWGGANRRAATEAGEIPLGATGGGTILTSPNPADLELLALVDSGTIVVNSAGVPASFGADVNNKSSQIPMKEYGDGIWYTCFPILSGSCSFNIRINGSSSNVSGAGGTIYGGFDPVKQQWDRTNHSAQLNYGGTNAPTGQLLSNQWYDDIFSIHPEYLVDYQDFLFRPGGTPPGQEPSSGSPVDRNTLSIWLPPGYDPNREEPYPVLYWCGGGGSSAGVGDRTIAENLIAKGLCEPFIMAGTGNNKYDGNSNRDALDYAAKYPDELYQNNSPVAFISLQNMAECVIPYMEANYNVSREASGRAVSGSSQGGKWASRLAYVYPELFGYVGTFLCGDEGVAVKLDAGLIPAGYDKLVFYLASGRYDFGWNWIYDVTKYNDNPWYGMPNGGGGGGTYPDGSCHSNYYAGLVRNGLQGNIYDGILHIYPGVHGDQPFGFEEFLSDVLWKWTPSQTDAEFLQGKAADILKNGLSTNSLVLNGKILTLVIDGREFVLSTNANNRNISGEIYLGNGYYLEFDIKGNGSNIKEFEVYKK